MAKTHENQQGSKAPVKFDEVGEDKKRKSVLHLQQGDKVKHLGKELTVRNFINWGNPLKDVRDLYSGNPPQGSVASMQDQDGDWIDFGKDGELEMI